MAKTIKSVVPVREVSDLNGTTTAIKTRFGNQVGTKYVLGCGPIGELRRALRKGGFTARQASEKIGEFLKGSGGNVAWAQAQTRLEVARSKGCFPTVFEDRDNGSFVLRGGVAPVVKDTKADKANEAKVNSLMAEIAELKAMLRSPGGNVALVVAAA